VLQNQLDMYRFMCGTACAAISTVTAAAVEVRLQQCYVEGFNLKHGIHCIAQTSAEPTG
jgi:hypothetical protein